MQAIYGLYARYYLRPNFIERVPDDVLREIFGKFTFTDLLNCSEVNKKWNVIIKKSNLIPRLFPECSIRKTLFKLHENGLIQARDFCNYSLICSFWSRVTKEKKYPTPETSTVIFSKVVNHVRIEQVVRSEYGSLLKIYPNISVNKYITFKLPPYPRVRRVLIKRNHLLVCFQNSLMVFRLETNKVKLVRTIEIFIEKWSIDIEDFCILADVGYFMAWHNFFIVSLTNACTLKEIRISDIYMERMTLIDNLLITTSSTKEDLYIFDLNSEEFIKECKIKEISIEQLVGLVSQFRKPLIYSVVPMCKFLT